MCGVGLIWKYKYFGDLRHYRKRKFSQAMGFVILLYGLDCIVKYNKILLVNRFLFLNFHEASVLFCLSLYDGSFKEWRYTSNEHGQQSQSDASCSKCVTVSKTKQLLPEKGSKNLALLLPIY